MSTNNRMLIVGTFALPTLQFGVNTAILNAPMNYMSCSVNTADCIQDWNPAIPNSIYALGGLLGCLLVPSFMKRFRIQNACFIYQVIYLFGMLALWWSHSMRQIIASRLLAGFAAGGSIVISPIALNLVSPPEWKGLIGSTTQISANVGIIIAQFLGYLYAETNFRLVFLYAFVLTALSTGFMFYLFYISSRCSLPESSYNLLTDGSHEKIRLGQYLRQRRYRYSLVVSISVFMLQQFTGINAIIVYGVSILSSIIQPLAGVVNLGLSVVNLVCTTLAAGVIDKFGRKNMLVYSLFNMGVFSLTMSLGIVNDWPVVTIVGSVLTIMSFAMGVGPIPFLLIGDVTPTEALDLAQSLGTAVSWLSMFAVVGGFPALQDSLGGWSFMIFSIFGFLGSLVYKIYLK